MCCPAPGEKIDRVILGLCTSHNSRLGKETQFSKGRLVVRITEDDDLTSMSCVKKAIKIMYEYRHLPILVWVSIPCTGGSSWQRLNYAMGKITAEQLQAHFTLYGKLMKSAYRICLVGRRFGAKIALEWPKLCSYWKDQAYIRFSSEFQLHSIILDGCMFGLKAQSGADAGKYIKKPWRIDTDLDSLDEYLGIQCDNSHEHTRCAGQHTKLTEGYTDQMVAAVHSGFQTWSERERRAAG